jgi:SWI/SNF-related matrix-associated actin-dependent regulator 1 of chromatin subfamily A
MIIKPANRRDWFDWVEPDPAWVREHAEVPGLQYESNGERIIRVTLHRTHLPLVPGAVCGHETIATPDHKPNTAMLRPYQAEDLPFLLSRRASLLCYEMRLGKTALACHAHNKHDGMLVVVGPLASRDVWRDWIERVHGVTPILCEGRKDIAMHPGFPAYFCHYDILDAHTKFFGDQEIGTLILDEIHLLQGRKTQRTAAANVLAVRASRIIGLSGTPMWSRPDSMYSLLHLIAPGSWGGHFAFAKHYAGAMPGAHGWNYNGLSHEDELSQRLSEIVVRRTWKDVLGQLPPTVRVVEPVVVTQDQVSKIEMLAEQARLIKGTISTAAGALATLRRKMSELKVGPAIHAAVQATIDDHKVVIWTWHNKTAEAIARKLPTAKVPGIHIRPDIAVFRLQADDNQRMRDAIIAGFKAHVGPCVMIASIAIGGVAIDLSCADYAIFAEFDWTPANMYQATMRTFHPSRPDTVLYLYADVPIERDLVDALRIREGFAGALNLGSNEITQAVLGRGGGV